MQCIYILENVSPGRHQGCYGLSAKSMSLGNVSCAPCVPQESYEALQDVLDHPQGNLLCVVIFYSYCNLTCLIHFF